MKISATDTVVRDEEPIAAVVDGETVILSAQAQAYFGLGETGSKIWGLLATPRQVSELCAELVREYDVDLVTCEQNTLDFLGKLLDDRLIRIVDAEADER